MSKAIVAAYARVSSRSQNFATQRDAVERMAKARGDTIERWYKEKQSGKKLERLELESIRQSVRTGGIAKLYVFRLDRLTRSGIRDTLNVLEELRAGGCKVVSVADGFDLEGPFAEIVNAVIAWAAQMERLALGERIAAARVRVEAKGGHWGRPARVPPLLATRIAMAREAGDTIRALSVRFKVPRSTVEAVLSGKGAYSARPARPKKAARKKR